MALTFALHLPRRHFALAMDASLAEGSVTGVVGPSGSGKSSLLRALAGVERAARGQLVFGAQHWLDGRRALAIERRRVGLVTQHPSLFRHLSPRDNLLFGYQRLAASERRLHPDELIARLGLAPLLALHTHQLSGGQQQRLMLGRALLANPRVLLLDEPVSALDAPARTELLDAVTDMARTHGMTTLLVSHQPEDLARCADQLLAVEHGRVTVCCDVREPVAHPLLGRDHVLSVLRGCRTDTRTDAHAGTVQLAGVASHTLVLGARCPRAVEIDLLVRARDIVVSAAPELCTSLDHQLAATVVQLTPSCFDGEQRLLLACGGQPLTTFLSDLAAERLALRPGQRVNVHFAVHACRAATPDARLDARRRALATAQPATQPGYAGY